jgi:hypothetical protein
VPLPKEMILRVLHQKLTNYPADVVVVDVFSDIFTGRDMNSNTEVREALMQYNKLAHRHKCLVILNHHPTKSGEKTAPDRSSMQGAGSFYAKSRGSFEIRGDEDGVTKYFSPVKANHLKTEFKALSFVMSYSEETGLFTYNGERIGKHTINQQVAEIDWAAVFEGQPEMRSGEIVRKLMDTYQLKDRAAQGRLHQLTQGVKYGTYRNPTIGFTSPPTAV